LFSTVIHLLTLAAFNVHALFGCCGHHVHEHSTCVHAEVCESSSCPGESHAHDSAEENAEGLINDFAAAWFGCDHPTQSPSDHSHSCDQGSCEFVMPRSVQHHNLIAVVAIVPIDGLRIVTDIAASHFNRATSDTRCAFTLAGHRCALQQSWQI